VILIDGTWAQASGIYYTNYDLHKLKQIKIDPDFTSAYIIRTQPRECFLSTLETVSLILSIIENKPKVKFYFDGLISNFLVIILKFRFMKI